MIHDNSNMHQIGLNLNVKPLDVFSEGNINNDSREDSQDYEMPEIQSKVKTLTMSRPKTVTQSRKGYEKNPF